DPVVGARIDVAALKGALERSTTTADDGTFGFASVPSEIAVSVARPESPDDVALRTTVLLKEGARREIELVLPHPRETMSVRVTDERGDPLDGVDVQVLSLSPESPLRRTLFTDKEGFARFKDAVGLPVRLRASFHGRAPTVREIESAPAETTI